MIIIRFAIITCTVTSTRTVAISIVFFTAAAAAAAATFLSLVHTNGVTVTLYCCYNNYKYKYEEQYN